MLLAEARIGAELKAAQARGEVATQDRHGRSRNSPRAAGTDLPITLSDLGIPSQRASEMKRLAELGEERIGAELKAAQARGEIGAQGRRSDFLRTAEEVKPAIADLGIPYQRAAEMKRLAERRAVIADARAAPVAG